MGGGSSSRCARSALSIRMVRFQHLAPTRFSYDLAIDKHGATTDDRAYDLAGELSVQIRTDAAACMKVAGAERPALLGVHDREVGVRPDPNRALARIQAEQLRRRGGGEMRNALDRQPARVHAPGYEPRHRALNSRRPAPCVPDVV